MRGSDDRPVRGSLRRALDPRPYSGGIWTDGQASAVRHGSRRDAVLEAPSGRLGDEPPAGTPGVHPFHAHVAKPKGKSMRDALGVTPIVLGPCRCQACGAPLTWNGRVWMFEGTDLVHHVATCPAPSSMKGKRL